MYLVSPIHLILVDVGKFTHFVEVGKKHRPGMGMNLESITPLTIPVISEYVFS